MNAELMQNLLEDLDVNEPGASEITDEEICPKVRLNKCCIIV